MKAINSLITNNIMVAWVAPIVTTLIATLLLFIISIVVKRKKSISVIKTITVANKRLMDSIRPFFIQRIKLNKDILLNIISSIAREYDLEIDVMLSTNEIKENIILDVSETRFLKDTDKMELIDFIDAVFKEYKVPETNNMERYNKMQEFLLEEREHIKNYNKQLVVTSSATILVSIVAFVVSFKKFYIGHSEMLFNSVMALATLVIVVLIVIKCIKDKSNKEQ